MGISFEHPWALAALLPLFLWWGWRLLRAVRPGRVAGPKGSRPQQNRWRDALRRSLPGAHGWMRLLIVLLLILALAGTGVTYSARHQAVMFVADLSVSTATARGRMETFIKEAVSAMPAGDLAGVLAVAEDAQLEAPVAARPTFAGFTAVVRPNHTDLERGLRLGAALLPSGYRPRLVLLSDGKENVGNAMAEVQRLRQRGYTVDVVNLSPESGPEALITAMEAPGVLREGERLDLTLSVSATAATAATLRIYEEQTLLETRPLQLQAGEQQVQAALEGLGPGYHRVWATLEAERDTLNQNNQAAMMVNVQGPPAVLVVEGFPGTGTNIRRALEATGMAVEVRTPDALPTHGPQFARYAGVVLVDVPAPLIPAAAMEAIAGYVKQSGHGLVVVGGENSYAMGGYGGTKLEELLPVSMEVPQRKEKPPVAVALIIENFESDAKVNISKEAGKALVDMLTPRDYILVGDATIVGGWQVPLQQVTDKARVKALIDAMAPGDPPHYMDHLEAAAAELKQVDAKIKHIVLAGDGDAQMIGFEQYAQRVARIAAEGITLSTIHVNWLNPGEEVLMQLIARFGNGRYYLAADANATPQIFLKEAQAMARPGVVEEDFVPAVLSRSPALEGLEGLPALRGYVATTPKPTGEVVLQSAQADPILATWQTGLGRVAAFTSDAGGLWSEHWVSWAQFSHFWSNVVSWTLPAVEETGLRTTSTVVGGKARLTVQLPGEGLEVGGLGGANSWPAQIVAGIIGPDGGTQVLPLQAMAPGQYEGEIPASLPGPYLVKLSAGTQRQSVQLGETFVVAPYSPEFAVAGSDPGFLQRLAAAGGGKVLSAAAEAFAKDLPPAPGRLPLDQFLLLAALLLWPVDIAMRRLSLTPAEVREAVSRRRAQRSAGRPAPASAASAALGRLRERRQEAVEAAEAAAQTGAQAPGSGRSVRPDGAGRADPAPGPQTAASRGEGPKRPAEPELRRGEEPVEPAVGGEGEESFTQRLLAARRKRR